MSINLFGGNVDDYQYPELDEAEKPLSQMLPDEMLVTAMTGAGMVDQNGRVTPNAFSMGSAVSDKNKQRAGYQRDEKGFFEGALDASNRTLRSIGSGVLKTVGQDAKAERIERGLEFRRDLDPVEWRDSWQGWLGDSIGMGLTESGAMIVGSAAAGALGAPAFVGAAIGVGSTYVRLYGENKQTLEEMNTMGLDESELTSLAVLLTLFQAGVEVGFGVETALGRAIGGRAVGNIALKRALATKEGRGVARRMASEFFKPTKIRTGVLFGSIKEYSEEVIQELAALKAEQKASGKYPTREEIIDRTLIQPLRALPAGALMGGFGAMMQAEGKAKEDSDVQKVTEDVVAAVHGEQNVETGVFEMTEAGQKSLEQENVLFAALAKDIARIKGVSAKSAGAITDFVRDLAYSMTKVLRKADPTVMPSFFIEKLKTVALKDNLSEQNVADIQAIQDNTELSPAERSDAIMDYISERLGDRSGFYGAMRSIRQTSQLLSIQNLSGMLHARMRQNGAVPLVDDAAVKTFNGKINAVITSLIGSNAAAKARVDSGQSFFFPISKIEDSVLNRIQAAQLYAYGAEIKIGKIKYVVEIRNNDIALIPAKDAKQEQKDARATQQSALERTQQEQRDSTLPVEEVIASDTALDQARADYAVLASKAMGLEDFLSYWSERATAQKPAAQTAGQVYQSVDGFVTMTSAEIDSLAAKNAESLLNPEDIAAAEQSVRQLGQDAYLRYNDAYMTARAKVEAEAIAASEAEVAAWEAVQGRERAAVLNDLRDNASPAAQEEVKTRRQAEKARKAEEKKVRKVQDTKNKLTKLVTRFNEKAEKAGVAFYPEFRHSVEGTLRQFMNAVEAQDLASARKIATVLDTFIATHSAGLKSMSTEAQAQYEADQAALAAKEADARALIDEKLRTEDEFTTLMNDIDALLKAYPTATQAEAAEMLRGEYTGDADLLLQEAQSTGTEIAGMYFGSRNTLVFFANADAGTVLHEIVHHMSGLLPVDTKLEIQQLLSGVEGVQKEIDEGRVGDKFEEAYVDSLITYIMEGKTPNGATDQIATTYHHMKEAIGNFTKNQLKGRDIQLSPETEAFFDEFFAEVSDAEIHGTMASAAATSMESDSPTSNMAQEADVLFQLKITKNKMDAKTQAEIARLGLEITDTGNTFVQDVEGAEETVVIGMDLVDPKTGINFTVDAGVSIIDRFIFKLDEFIANPSQPIEGLKARKAEVMALKDRVVDQSDDLLFQKAGNIKYHVTKTENVDSIKKNGLTRMNTTNWATATGERQGAGEVYAFDNYGDALAWASKMDWTQNQQWGSGNISIVKFDGKGEWDVDNNSPFEKAGARGEWYKSNNPVALESILDVRVATREEILKANEPDVLFQRTRYTPESSEAETEIIKGKIIKSLHGKIKPDEEGVSAHTGLHLLAQALFPDQFEGRTVDQISLKELTLSQLTEMQKILNPKNALPKESAAIRDSILEGTKDMPTAEHPDTHYDRWTKQFAAKINKVVQRAIDLNDSMFTNLAHFIRKLDGFKFNGAYAKNIMEPIALARQASARTGIQFKETFSLLRKKHGVKSGFLSQRKDVNINGRMFSESEMVLISMAAIPVATESGVSSSRALNAIMQSNEVSQEQVNEIVKRVAADKDLTAHAKYFNDAYSYLYNEIAPIYKEVAGRTLPARENYFPMIRQDTMWAEADIISNLLESVAPQGRFHTTSKTARFKSATQVAGSVIRLDNADDALSAYAAAAANYIGKAPTIKTISTAVNSAEFKNNITRIYGASQGGKVYGMLQRLIERELYANAKTTGMDEGQMLAKNLRTKFTLTLLGGKVMTVPKQNVSFYNFMAELSGAMSPRFMAGAVANSFTIAQFMMSNAATNLNRFRSGSWKVEGYLHLLEGHPLYDLLKEYAPIILDRHGNPETADFEQHGYTGFLALKIHGIPIGDFAMGGIKMMDMLTVGTAWMTGYEHVYQQEMAKHADPQRASLEAAKVINEIISDTQPPSVAHERAPAQTDSEYIRGLFPFSGQTMLNWQNWTGHVLAPSIRMLKEGDVKGLFRREGYHSPVVQRLALGFMVPAIALGALSRRRWPKDKEEMVLDMILYPLSQTPALGSAIASGISTGWRDSASSATYMSIGNDITRTMIDFTNAVAKRERFGYKETKDAVEIASTLSGMPTAYSKFLLTIGLQVNKGGFESVTFEKLNEALGMDRKD